LEIHIGGLELTVETYFQRYILSGGVMMIFLIPCSFLAVWFIFQGFINLRRSRIVPGRLLSFAREMKTETQRSEMVEWIRRSSSSLCLVLRRLLDMNPPPAPEELDDVTSELIDDEVSRLYHKNNQLAVIYTVSPLLGLLGTIMGMMRTFYVFSGSEQHSIAQLSQGINEALVTTMWGLSIAIPSFVVLYLFKQRLFYYEMTLLPGAVKEIWGLYQKYPEGEIRD